MKKENPAFISFQSEKSELIFDDSLHKEYPIRYYHAINNLSFIPSDNCSYYVYIYEGTAGLYINNVIRAAITKGQYFSVSGYFNLQIIDECYKAVIIEVLHEKGIYPNTNFSAVTTIGGPIEKTGRLKYIDGCTDSVLINPVKMGDPCLNHLHFPSNITQTPHTHPSHRIGIVAKGEGECITPFGNLPLIEGMIFVIKAWDGKSYDKGLDGNSYEVGNHCFYTYESSMDVIAFHPDSDFGAQDINHPMINRTIVNGISANSIKDIRTK